MSSHPQRYEACPVCQKRVYPSWKAALKASADFMRLSGKARGVAPYWSKPCRAYHLGASTQGAYRKARNR